MYESENDVPALEVGKKCLLRRHSLYSQNQRLKVYYSNEPLPDFFTNQTSEHMLSSKKKYTLVVTEMIF